MKIISFSAPQLFFLGLSLMTMLPSSYCSATVVATTTPNDGSNNMQEGAFVVSNLRGSGSANNDRIMLVEEDDEEYDDEEFDDEQNHHRQLGNGWSSWDCFNDSMEEISCSGFSNANSPSCAASKTDAINLGAMWCDEFKIRKAKKNFKACVKGTWQYRCIE